MKKNNKCRSLKYQYIFIQDIGVLPIITYKKMTKTNLQKFKKLHNQIKWNFER